MRNSCTGFLIDTYVPPLVIQTFVENTVKHAVTLDEPIHISIDIDVIELEGVPCISIVIQDSGKGFPDEVLFVLQQGEVLSRKKGNMSGYGTFIEDCGYCIPILHTFLFQQFAKWSGHFNHSAYPFDTISRRCGICTVY